MEKDKNISYTVKMESINNYTSYTLVLCSLLQESEVYTRIHISKLFLFVEHFQIKWGFLVMKIFDRKKGFQPPDYVIMSY